MTKEDKTKGAIPEAKDLPESEKEDVKETNGNVKDAEPITELSLESLQDQVDELRSIVAQLAAQAGVPRVRTQAEVDALVKEQKAAASFTSAQKTEKEIRRYVKRDGGYRKDTTRADKALVGRLLKKLGRKTVAWDTDLLRG